MKLTIAECTTLLEALNGPSVESPKAAALYDRVRAEREELRAVRDANLRARLAMKANK